ncbi:NEDD8-activating enzyme E1 regulatory subunit [Boothiomyces macroporosus]|uniref:NEDD8-activating enzyme E1 regulatory subunit n=1 Tax=Boothiomyces macroporosus TaxID=261099 RepID=A0AAD5ULS7_9FUNG|nr:NEDD8-activating enzyme E1 regulatory subunit [Boothiomyces macroporosus]
MTMGIAWTKTLGKCEYMSDWCNCSRDRNIKEHDFTRYPQLIKVLDLFVLWTTMKSQHEDIGQLKAQCISKSLNELNPEVKGSFIAKDASKLIKTEPEIFKQFSLIIVSELSEYDLLALAEIAWNENIPLVTVRTYGFLGFMHLVFPEHTVIETHPESSIDLRLDCPWSELIEYAEKFKMNADDSMVLTHTPFPVILLKAAKIWKQNHASYPSTKDERISFQQAIKDLLPNVAADEENLKEAESNCSRLFRGTLALKLFMENEGKNHLPLPGNVPDMKADTESYVQLQRLYHNKAEADKQCLKNYVVTLCSNLKRRMIDSEIIDIFCKNAAFLKVLGTNSLKSHFNSSPDEQFSSYGIMIENACKNGDNQLYYLVLRTADRFKTLHGRYPGTVDENFESDLVAFEALFDTFLKEVGILDANYHAKVKEIVYAGARELPSVAALLGGIASQEVIKLITHQYLPVDNCYIFDGVTSTSTSFKL